MGRWPARPAARFGPGATRHIRADRSETSRRSSWPGPRRERSRGKGDRRFGRRRNAGAFRYGRATFGFGPVRVRCRHVAEAARLSPARPRQNRGNKSPPTGGAEARAYFQLGNPRHRFHPQRMKQEQKSSPPCFRHSQAGQHPPEEAGAQDVQGQAHPVIAQPVVSPQMPLRPLHRGLKRKRIGLRRRKPHSEQPFRRTLNRGVLHDLHGIVPYPAAPPGRKVDPQADQNEDPGSPTIRARDAKARIVARVVARSLSAIAWRRRIQRAKTGEPPLADHRGRFQPLHRFRQEQKKLSAENSPPPLPNPPYFASPCGRCI